MSKVLVFQRRGVWQRERLRLAIKNQDLSGTWLMNSISLVIEVYGGVVQNVCVAHELPDALLQAVVVDWDYEHYDGQGDCVVYATGLDGDPALAYVSRVRLKPWRLLPAAGILDVLDRAGMATFGMPTGEASPLNQPPGR